MSYFGRGKSKTAETLSVHAAKKTIRIVKARGEAIGANKSKFAAAILDWWVAQGCPAINKLDVTMRSEVMAKLKAEDDAEAKGNKKAA